MQSWEQLLQTVLVEHKPDMDAIGSIEGMSHALPLLNEQEVRRQQERLLEYPDGLALNVIRAHSSLLCRRLSRVSGDGHGPRELFYWDAVTATLKNLLGMLAGLNHVYYSPGEPRWYKEFLDKLDILPAGMTGRMDHILHHPGPSALVELRQLLLDTLELVRQNYPQEVSERMLQAIGRKQ